MSPAAVKALCFLMLACTLTGPAWGAPQRAPQIAIIIDDIGYKLREGERSIELPQAVTLAIIPSTPYARKFANTASCQQNKEVLVHMPMTPGRKIAWEEGLNQQMKEVEFIRAAERLLLDVPFAIGVNNHGGSQLTQDRERMDWLMSVLERQGLFFVDSRTTPASVAGEAAASASIPYTVRDVFMDNKREPEAIHTQLDKLVAIASELGQAIAIAHPYPETLAVLEARLPELQKQGFELVGISRLLRHNANYAVTEAHKTSPTLPETDSEERELDR